MIIMIFGTRNTITKIIIIIIIIMLSKSSKRQGSQIVRAINYDGRTKVCIEYDDIKRSKPHPH